MKCVTNMTKKSFLLVSLLFLAALYTSLSVADTAIISKGVIAPGWANWSWNTSYQTSTTTQYNGNPTLSISYNAGWAGFSLDNSTPVNTATYQSLQIAVYGSTGLGSNKTVLALTTQDNVGNASTAYYFTPIANTWSVITVPLTALGSPAQIARLNIQDYTSATIPTYYIGALTLVAAPVAKLSLTVDATAARHAISPLIYGINDINATDASLWQALGITVNRWGGNETSRYNWQFDTYNHANDWFFENDRMGSSSTVNAFITATKKAGAKSLVTVPMIGYVAKDGNLSTCGFSVAKYGPQKSTDPYRPDCGNGTKTNGSLVTGNNPADTSLAVSTPFITSWLNYLVQQYGNANNGGVAFYNLDNEPDIWFSTHQDVAPVGLTYDQLMSLSTSYAAAIKAVDPGAKILGPVVDGWTYYWNSPNDGQQGLWSTTPDRNAHGGIPLIPWYLQQMQAYEKKTGVRLLDYLDVHYYPAEAGVALSPAGNTATQALRLQSTRSLWDPSYVDQSWISSAGPNNGIIQLIPLLRNWVSANYPGTQLAISEYNWGAPESINGALAQADVLGIFGREGLGLATLWPDGTLSANQPLAYAFRLYRNYDGLGSTFGDTSVSAISNYPANLAIYAAENSSNGALTLMVINKTAGSLTAPLSLSHFTPSGVLQTWRYSPTNLNQIVHLADQTIKGTVINSTFPANSVTLYVIAGNHS